MEENTHSLENHQVPETKIFISIDHLKEGVYKLQVTHKNKTVKSIKFTKK